MAKTGPLGKLEKYYIEGHYKDQSVDELAYELDRSKTAVNNYIKKLKQTIQEEADSEFKIGDRIPVNNNPIVMTEADAAKADVIAQRRGTLTQRMSDCITTSKQPT